MAYGTGQVEEQQTPQEAELATQPLVTVITSTYNAAKTLQACLESIKAQDYPNVEHIVVDGASKDGTLALLQGFKNDKLRYISEPDKGIFDAWNKGIAQARGEWITFVGADDVLFPHAISSYVALAAKHPEAIFLSGQMEWTNSAGVGRVVGKPWSWPLFQKYECIAFLGCMHHRRLFEEYGVFDSSLKIVADYELLLRPGKHFKTAFLPEVTGTMAGGGNSDTLAALDEAAKVKVSTGKRAPWLVKLERLIAGIKFRMRRTMARFS